MPIKKSKKITAKKTTNKKATTKAVNKKVKAVPKKKTTSLKKIIKKNTANKSKAPKKKVGKLSVAKKKRAAKKKEPQISSYKPKKNEKYMSAAMKRHFNKVLLNWRLHLREEMQKTFNHLKNKGETFADPIDRASQEEEFAFELRTRDRERKLIKKIVSSLEQIKQDDYGYCYSCGIEIGLKRLEARPTATHCIDCKTLDEIKEKQLGG